MKKSLCLFVPLLLLVLNSCSDDSDMDTNDNMNPADAICTSNRYLDNEFEEFEVSTVKFGEALNDSGEMQELFMDIYTPKGDDIENRPVMILAFGGAFFTGDRSTMQSFAEQFAAKGYVAASVDYRLTDNFLNLASDSLYALETAYKASLDIKAAIRHFRKDAANGNPYNIDESKIFIGGVSAGAIASLNAAIMDDEDLTEQHVIDMVERSGGLEGQSGDAENLSYSSEVAGVLNLSGGIYRLEYLDADDPPVFSFHGDNDNTVPYEYDFVSVLFVDIIPIYGSKSLNDYAEANGFKNQLLTVPGGDHTLIYTSDDFSEYRDQLESLSATFFKEIICE